MESITRFITKRLKLKVNKEGRRRAAKALSGLPGGTSF
jgi:hypothetical protein